MLTTLGDRPRGTLPVQKPLNNTKRVNGDHITGWSAGNSWRKVRDIEVSSPTRAVMRFSSPAPTAPQWLAFMGSFVVPKAYLSGIGADEFARRPVGTGPYRLAEYEMNSRIVLERYDGYWGPKPQLSRVTVQIVKDPSARVAAVQSGQADLTFNIPIREVPRLARVAGVQAEANPVTRIIMLHARNDLNFADPRVRLAAHHAIDKAALSKAFYRIGYLWNPANQRRRGLSLIPFDELRSTHSWFGPVFEFGGNIAFFVPFGILIYVLLYRMGGQHPIRNTVIIGAFASILMETAQYVFELVSDL